MTADLAMWLLGITSLSLMAAVSTHILAEEVGQWRRIWDTMLGRHLSSSASVASDPHQPRRPKLHATAPDAELTDQVAL
jgi:hypothetical protein